MTTTETHTLWLNPLTGGTELVPRALALDARDSAILRERYNAFNERPGPRVGDYVRFPDGEVRRFTHDWEEYGLQTNTPKFGPGSFYFSAAGYCDYSGALDPCVKREALTLTDETQDGSVWFFHHDYRTAGGGVTALIPCRVYESSQPQP